MVSLRLMLSIDRQKPKNLAKIHCKTDKNHIEYAVNLYHRLDTKHMQRLKTANDTHKLNKG